jgi:transposase
LDNTIDANYTETYLFPPSLEDFVARDDPARFIRAFVDSLDIEALGMKIRESETGRPDYSPRLLLRVWLYGWFERVHSTRQLEKLCRRDVGMMWLTGLHCPDHNTIWRFYRDNKPALKRLFKQSVRVAMMNDLVGMVLHALDGTKIRADANRYAQLSKKRLEKKLLELDGAIEQAVAAMDKNEDDETPREQLPAQLQDEHRLREKIQRDLARLAEAQRPNVNTTDPQSRLMQTREGATQYCYNAQAVVDAKSGILTGAEVSQDERDHLQLNRQLCNVEETTGLRAQRTVTDSGYFSGAQLAKAEECEHDVVVEIPERYNENQYHTKDSVHHVNNYAYDSRQDSFVCPYGGLLRFRRKKAKDTLEYECERFGVCKHRGECTTSSRNKRITVSRYHASIRRQRQRHSDENVRAILRRRKSLIEPVFGIIKHVLGFRRLTARGLVNASAQWYLVCCIHNLRKLYRYRGMRAQFT